METETKAERRGNLSIKEKKRAVPQELDFGVLKPPPASGSTGKGWGVIEALQGLKEKSAPGLPEKVRLLYLQKPSRSRQVSSKRV